MALFDDPRMKRCFVRTWDDSETFCAKVAISRQEKINKLEQELEIMRKNLIAAAGAAGGGKA